MSIHAPILLSSDPPPLDPPKIFDIPIALRKGTHQCKSTYSIAIFFLISCIQCLIASLNSISIPKTVKDALNHLRWHKAMFEDLRLTVSLS